MRVVLVGDVMLGRSINELLMERPAVYPWGDTLPLFRDADWRGCNLECVVSDRGRPWSKTPKTFHFRSDAKNVAVLKAAGLDAVSLANNHTLDFGHRAMREMLRLLDEGRIAHSGAGESLVAAAAPAVMGAGGLKIGWISFTDNQPEWEATENDGGIFFVPIDVRGKRAERLFDVVRGLRRQCDLLIVAAHWGDNWGYRPPDRHIEFGHELVAAGADVIFGHSAHVFRGVEIYEGRPIVYSTGDFVDDYAVDPVERNDQSFVFELETEGSVPCHLRLHPTVIRDFQARLATDREAREISEKMTRLCGDFDTLARWHPMENCVEIAIRR